MEPQPHGSDGKDEVEGFLIRLERLIWGVTKGIFVFFFKIPKWIYEWTYELLRSFLDHLWHYCERLIRYTYRLTRLAIVTVIFGTVVIGPGVALWYWGPPHLTLPVWCVLIVCAIGFGLRRFQRKYREWVVKRQIRRGVKQSGVQLKCAKCETHDPNDPSPKICRFCGCKPWVGVPI